MEIEIAKANTSKHQIPEPPHHWEKRERCLKRFHTRKASLWPTT